ncbi:MAG: hypothetical protein BWY31_01895 [Lentisphaerae bacterium ADurb.Bin242]|nr:MAG: hypothetical protein BWY31_01895 [Lentisphaerae bacterium ADurb.Bin242]
MHLAEYRIFRNNPIRNFKGIWIIFLSAFTLSAQENLIKNGSFEEGIKEWMVPSWKRADGKIWVEPVPDKGNSQGIGGMCSMRLDYAKNKICHLNYFTTISLPPGKKDYTFSVWTKSEGYDQPTKGQLTVVLNLPEIQKNHVLLTPWNKLQENWTQFRQDIQIPDSCTKATLRIGIHGYDNERGTTWVDNLYLGPKLPENPPPAVKKLTLLRGVPHAVHGGVWYPDEKMEYDIELKEIAEPGTRATLNWQAEDFDRKVLCSGKKEIVLPENPRAAVAAKGNQSGHVEPAKIRLELPSLGDFRGWFAMKVDISQGIKRLDEVTSSGIVVEKQEGRRDPFFTAKGPGSVEKQIRMGNGSASFQVERRYLQTGPSSYKLEILDKKVEETVNNGFEPTFSFMFTQKSSPQNQLQPPYLRHRINEKLAKGIDPYDKEYYEGWRGFLRMLAGRYGTRVHDWYVGDEIYHTYHNDKYEIPHYVALTRLLHSEVKKNNPENVVGGGGVFMDMSPIGKEIWPQVKDSVDGLSCSLYLQKGTVEKGLTIDGPESGGLLKRFAFTRSIIGPDKFIAATETGYSFIGHPPIDSDRVKEVAVINARNLVMLKYLKVRRWTYFLFENDPMYESAKYGFGTTDYGMWNRKTGCPKPHAAAWAVSARVLAFVTDPREVKPRSDVYCYLFRKNGKTLAVLWAYTKDWVSTKIDMPADWNGMDFMGKREKGKKGILKRKINDRPLYFELDAPQETVADAFRNARYVMPEAYLTINRKNANEVNVFVKNKLTTETTALVRLNNSAPKTVKIPGNAILPVSFPHRTGTGPVTASALVNGVRYEVSNTDEIYPVAHLASPPAMDGSLKGFESVKPLVMDSRRYVMPTDADGHGLWTGKEDLSVKIYLAYDKDFFYIAADVTDDVHIVRTHGIESWNQDSLQFAFDTENNAFDPAITPAGYQQDDVEFVTADTTKGPELFCHSAGGQSVNQLMSSKPVVKRRADNHTIYETRIPWFSIGSLKPVPGSVFGFNTVVFDLDMPTGLVSCQMEFSPGITYGKTPALFKRFILE